MRGILEESRDDRRCACCAVASDPVNLAGRVKSINMLHIGIGQPSSSLQVNKVFEMRVLAIARPWI